MKPSPHAETTFLFTKPAGLGLGMLIIIILYLILFHFIQNQSYLYIFIFLLYYKNINFCVTVKFVLLNPIKYFSNINNALLTWIRINVIIIEI